VEGDVSVDSETLLLTDFVNLKIKSTQFFKGAPRGRMCVRIFIEVSAHTYMSIFVCTMFFLKSSSTQETEPSLLTLVLFSNAVAVVIMRIATDGSAMRARAPRCLFRGVKFFKWSKLSCVIAMVQCRQSFSSLLLAKHREYSVIQDPGPTCRYFSNVEC
jgi:hypothetical protein